MPLKELQMLHYTPLLVILSLCYAADWKDWQGRLESLSFVSSS
jgi:hypothetical protein